MTFETILPKVITFLVIVFISLIVAAFSLFIASKILIKSKNNSYGKAFSVLLNIFIGLFLLWILAQIILWVLFDVLKIPDPNLPGGINWLIWLIVLIFVVIYAFKRIRVAYAASTMKAIFLIIIFVVVNILVMYLLNFIFDSLNINLPVPIYDVLLKPWFLGNG